MSSFDAGGAVAPRRRHLSSLLLLSLFMFLLASLPFNSDFNSDSSFESVAFTSLVTERRAPPQSSQLLSGQLSHQSLPDQSLSSSVEKGIFSVDWMETTGSEPFSGKSRRNLSHIATFATFHRRVVHARFKQVTFPHDGVSSQHFGTRSHRAASPPPSRQINTTRLAVAAANLLNLSGVTATGSPGESIVSGKLDVSDEASNRPAISKWACAISECVGLSPYPNPTKDASEFLHPWLNILNPYEGYYYKLLSSHTFSQCTVPHLSSSMGLLTTFGLLGSSTSSIMERPPSSFSERSLLPSSSFLERTLPPIFSFMEKVFQRSTSRANCFLHSPLLAEEQIVFNPIILEAFLKKLPVSIFDLNCLTYPFSALFSNIVISEFISLAKSPPLVIFS